MKRLTISLRLFLTFFSLVLAENLLGQEPAAADLQGSGTENDPWLISSTTEWNAFADAVNGGYSYSGKYVKLTADITISNIAGTWSNRTTYKAFSGTFDGGDYTITFNNETSQALCAPFRVINGATIENLVVDGTIVTSQKYAAGFVGYVYGSSNISNCISNINITYTGGNDATHGGFVGQQESGTLTFEECIFEGYLTGGSGAKKVAGFVGWRGETVTYKNCIQAGKIISYNSNTATYHRGTNGGGTFDHAYYIFTPSHLETYGLQGDAYESSAMPPTDDIYRKYTDNTNNYYVSGVVVTGLENTMYSSSEGSQVEIAPVVKFRCRTLTRGTDYIVKVDGVVHSETPLYITTTASDHTVVIEGNGGYAGSQTFNFVKINGSGTEVDPFQIPTTDIWNAFATSVNGGSIKFNDKFFKLTANITVSEMVGTEDNPFKGTFIGKNGGTTYTLTFNKGTSEAPFNEKYCAPFRYINGATIKDLNVAGATYSSKDRAAGLIGKSSGTSTVQDVTVSANIIASEKYYCSGFASANNGTLSFTRCIYNGKIVAGSISAGFCASGSGTTNINTCMFKPAAETSVSGGYSLANSINNITAGYYTYKIGGTGQGYQAYTSQPDKVLTKKMTLMDGIEYYVDGLAEIDGVEKTYTYTGNSITITYTVKFFGATFDAANYNVTITPSPVVNRGDYKLTVSGVNGNNYYGSTSKDFSVVSGPLAGSGTEANPYLITSAADWGVVVERVSYGLDVDKYYQLTADIEVSTMIGQSSSNKRFKGVFDGNWHKITFNKGTAESPFNEDYCAPFRYVEDATIQNLTVDGTIISSKKYVGGLAGYFSAYNKGNIVNCTSSVNINCTYITGDCYYGGFVGNVNSSADGYLRFRNCMFDGNIFDNKATKDAEICSGFIGYVTVQAIDYTRDMIYVNCCMNGTISVKGKTANFHRGSSIPTLFFHTYYLKNNTNDEAVQGEAAPTTVPANYISKKYTISAEDRYVPGAVVLSLEAVSGGKAPVMSYYGSKLTRGTHISVSETSNPYTISGVSANSFYGSVTTRIVDNWTDLNAALKVTGMVDLVADVTAGSGDGALEVSGNRTVTLNMNGHTVDRHLSAPANLGHVIRILNKNTLTINGNGTITGGYNKATTGEIDGGGIYNMGTLTLNSVYISKNHCEKKDGEDHSARGGGVYSGTGSSLTMKGCYITDNTAQGGGGGVYGNKASTFDLDDVFFFSNTSESKGGGVRVLSPSDKTASIKNCTFILNTVTAEAVIQAAQGGGVYMEDGNLYMQNNDIWGNLSNLQGCGLYQNKGTITAENCRITDNGSYHANPNSEGAGVYLNSGIFTMNGGLIMKNNAYAGTGGIYINKGANLKLTGNITIFDNYVAQVGGSKSFKNVYIADPSITGVIEILSGFDSESKIAVFKNFSSGFNGVFTKNLYENGGTVSNFVTDDAAFQISQTGGLPNEAQFAAPKAWDACVNGVDYNRTGSGEPYSYEILKPVSVVTGNVTANTISFSGAGCLYIQENSTLTAEFIDNDDPVRLVIEDGGQVITTSENVEATVKKNTTEEKWYLISSAIDNPDIVYNTNVITAEVPTDDTPIKYDLYRFNEAASLQWENYRAGHGDFTRFTNGRGYLYRHAILWGYTIIMEGTLNVGTRVGGGEEDNTWIVTYPLSFAGTNELKGFNLIGNPYSHNIYKNDVYQREGDTPAINDADLAVGYYVLNSAADAFEAKIGYNNPIKSCDGILVQTTSAHDLVITNTTNPAAVYVESKSGEKRKSGYEDIMFEVANNEYSDVAYAMFIDGAGLNKIEHINDDVPMLYINHYDEDYAIATISDETKAFNLNFEAKTFGRYTLSVKPQGGYRYLHLIDRLAEKDIDLLVESEYSFIGSPADNANRFIVRLEHSDSVDDEVFAYQSGNDIVVAGEGELQVFDVMGRLVAQKHVNGVETMCTSSLKTGVYVFRLNDMTQKIVIR